jgi:hypothetical protein
MGALIGHDDGAQMEPASFSLNVFAAAGADGELECFPLAAAVTAAGKQATSMAKRSRRLMAAAASSGAGGGAEGENKAKKAKKAKNANKE